MWSPQAINRTAPPPRDPDSERLKELLENMARRAARDRSSRPSEASSRTCAFAESGPTNTTPQTRRASRTLSGAPPRGTPPRPLPCGGERSTPTRAAHIEPTSGPSWLGRAPPPRCLRKNPFGGWGCGDADGDKNKTVGAGAAVQSLLHNQVSRTVQNTGDDCGDWQLREPVLIFSLPTVHPDKKIM